MYISQLTIRTFRQFGEGSAELNVAFQQGVTALIGRNDSGTSAVIDAIRYALLTREQEFIRVQADDFHIDSVGKQATEIFLCCKLTGCLRRPLAPPLPNAYVAAKDSHPRTLVQYIQVAHGLAANGRTLYPGVEKFAAGIFELARRIGDLGVLNRNVRTHRTLLAKLDEKPSICCAYTKLLNRYLVDRVCPAKADWVSHCDSFWGHRSVAL